MYSEWQCPTTQNDDDGDGTVLVRPTHTHPKRSERLEATTDQPIHLPTHAGTKFSGESYSTLRHRLRVDGEVSSPRPRPRPLVVGGRPVSQPRVG